MSDQPESIDAVLAEMREWSTDENDALACYADRIDAAADRMRESYCELCQEKDAAYDRLLLERDEAIKATAPGNAAAMRKALERCNELFRCDDDNKSRLCHLARKADEATQAALSAPARNCDRFKTLDEAREAFQDLRGHKILADVELWDSMDEAGALVRWLFATAEGGDHA